MIAMVQSPSIIDLFCLELQTFELIVEVFHKRASVERFGRISSLGIDNLFHAMNSKKIPTLKKVGIFHLMLFLPSKLEVSQKDQIVVKHHQMLPTQREHQYCQ